jgi:hypothetical protein
MHYQVRGYYDADEDMIPFFSVSNLPTAGDVAGAAVVDPQDASKGLLDIVMPDISDAPNGYERGGVLVALGQYVWMERPMFAPSERHRFLNAENKVKLVLKPSGLAADPTLTVNATWAESCEDGSPDCGFRLEQLTEDEARATLDAADIGFDFSPQRYAFLSQPVDVLTIRKGAPDLKVPDGIPDPHPLLGSSAGIPWVTPLIIMTRNAPTVAMAAVEKRARIPAVRLIGSPLLNAAANDADRRMRLGSLPVAVPNIAVVELTPDPQCRIPYIAPHNFTLAYEAALAYCSDLPTGVFGINAIQGAAGGRVVEETNSDTGYGFSGNILSGQVWSVPNELASPVQVGPGKQLASQGRQFVVHDPRLDETDQCDTAYDALTGRDRAINFRKTCEADQEIRVESALDPQGVDGQACLPSNCCDAVKHLCNLPLCPACTDGTCPNLGLGDLQVRQGPTKIERTVNGVGIPNCVPFAVPAFCCE